MKIYKQKHEMNEGDMVAGVVYAAAAEQVIRKQFTVHRVEGGEGFMNLTIDYQPTVIGYMVLGVVDDVKEGIPDLDRRFELITKRRLTDLELKELAAINRRLGYDVTS